jgi:putative membrane protein
MNEFIRIQKSLFLQVAMIAVACLPLIYAGLYLWAFWDPYARINQLPVAVVNEDKGGLHDGEYQNIGQELVDDLSGDTTMAWNFVPKSTALAGIASRKYVAAIMIPENLTTSVQSVDSSSPRQGKITYVARDATNMLATKIADRVFLELTQKLNQEVSEKLVEKVFFKIRDIRDSLEDATVGTSDLVDGMVKLTDGSQTLHDGLVDIYNGTKDLDNGLFTLKNNNGKLVQGSHDAATASATIRDNLSLVSGGTQSLVTGLTQLSGGMTSLTAGLIQAASGSSQLAANSQTIASNLTQTASGAAQLAAGNQSLVVLLKSFQANHPELATDSSLLTIIATAEQTASGAGQLNNGLNQLVPGENTIIAGLNTLAQQLVGAVSGSQTLAAGASQSLSGSTTINSGVTALSAGATTLANGTTTLESGVHDYTDGVAKVKDGTHELVNGADKAQSGSQELTNNLKTAQDGSQELHDKLTDGYHELVDQTTNKVINDKKGVISKPITSTLLNFGEVANYGTGFTPYFIPLALWVGAMAIFFIVKPIEIGTAPWYKTPIVVWSKQQAAIVLGMLQSVLLIAVLMIGLGLKVKYLALFIGFVALISIAFIALMQWFTAIGGEAAKFIAIVLLMMQLTSSGGTYPVETAPTFFQRIGIYLPMTYAVSGLREIISGDNLGLITTDIKILSLIALAGFVATCLSRKWWKQPAVLGEHE